jgi:hypothetical protein
MEAGFIEHTAAHVAPALGRGDRRREATFEFEMQPSTAQRRSLIWLLLFIIDETI